MAKAISIRDDQVEYLDIIKAEHVKATGVQKVSDADAVDILIKAHREKTDGKDS